MVFLRRRRRTDASGPPPPQAVQEEVTAQQFALKLTYLARTSNGLRLRADSRLLALLPGIVAPLSHTPVEALPPLPVEQSDASPRIERFEELQRWVAARSTVGAIGRHALLVLELTDAIDMTVDSLACGLLHGDTDTTGYPEYNAIVGGLASHWDELSGEPIVRSVVAWGGKGVRGDTERIGQRMLSALYQQVLASGYTIGTSDGVRLGAGSRRGDGLACTHCGFETGSAAAFYCPKCGMRMARGA
ncbi:MAG: hypothetical protein DLM71_02775 [Chloroflexi bacterium]|nr:MAG: hypothetical protein DLM71_02775 [Chloroflexota bacterium]